jgi:hypothetical protein
MLTRHNTPLNTKKPPGADTLDGSKFDFARQQNNQILNSRKAASACLQTYQLRTQISSSTYIGQDDSTEPTDKATDQQAPWTSHCAMLSETGGRQVQMTDTHTATDRPVFKSKLRRQHHRQRIHKRTVFDEARYREIKAKCRALAKTVVATPAPRCKPLPDFDRLHALLVADFETGVLTARVKRPRLQPGDTLGTHSSGGYLQIYIDNEPYRVHRLIWKMFHGRDPVGHVDHRDGSRSNNAIRNLRDVTPLQNSRNRCKVSTNSSGRLGVSKCSRTGLWAADIGCNDQVINLGKYKRLECAIAARECGEKYLFGAVSQNREAA